MLGGFKLWVSVKTPRDNLDCNKCCINKDDLFDWNCKYFKAFGARFSKMMQINQMFA